MKKISRSIYFIFGVIAPIAIGALHLFVHFKELVTPEVQALLSTETIVNNLPTTYYNVWGLVSFMMGASFIIIGLLNLVVFRKLAKDAWPPVQMMLVMMLYLACTIYAGNEFNAMPQFWGSIVGMIGIITGIILTLKNRNHA